MVIIFYAVAGFYSLILFVSFFSKNKYIYPWGTLILILLPLAGSFFTSYVRGKTGCSEYEMFRSAYCEEKSAQLNINLEEAIFLTEFLIYLLFTFVSIPAFIALVFVMGVSYFENRKNGTH